MVALLTLTACSDDPNPADRPSTHPTPPAPIVEVPRYQVVEVTETGTIRGNVRWRGEHPETPSIPVESHPEICGATQPSRALRISERGGVADVVVSIDARRGAALEAPESPPVIDNVGCRFEPHVSAVGAGWALIFRNSDELLHNVHGYAGDDTVIDLGLPERGSEAPRALEEPGVFRFVCDAGHGWQQAWIHAFDHPYFAKTDEDGRFLLRAVPPGQYTLRLWHEGWRIVGRRAGRPRWSNPVVLSRAVSVSSQQETVVDFELSEQSGEIAGE
ncbi:MAG: carboxypeptidase regulatory-like domain-containing protein [Sandaracinaceae bacterium]